MFLFEISVCYGIYTGNSLQVPTIKIVWPLWDRCKDRQIKPVTEVTPSRGPPKLKLAGKEKENIQGKGLSDWGAGILSVEKFALIRVYADLRKGAGCVSGMGRSHTVQRDHDGQLGELAVGSHAWLPSTNTNTRNDLLSNLPFLLFFLPLIVNIPSLLKLASQLKLNTDYEPSNGSGVFFFFLHPTNNWDGMHLNKPKVISLF